MQPYLFPYLGYFQLMDYADKFFLLDNVNFIKRGWINRNNILLNQKPYRFTLPLHEVSQHKKVNEISIAADQKWKKNFMETLRVAYQHAPFYKERIDLIHGIIYYDDDRISAFIYHSLESIAGYIGIKTDIIVVSPVEEREGMKGQDRIINICEKERATEYINLPGGKSLYETDAFLPHNIRLSFIEPHLTPYPQQQKGEFLAGLSIIDVLMNNSTESIQQMISDYAVVSA